MNPLPPPKLFIAIHGQIQGPYSADDVVRLRADGTVPDEALICAEGGLAWVPVKEYELPLPAAPPPVQPPLPPVQPTGYSGGVSYSPSGVRTTAIAPKEPVAIAAPSDGTKRLRIGTLVAALILFFLPWVEMRCAETRFMYQTGVQTIISSVSIDLEVEKMGGVGVGKSDTYKTTPNYDAKDMSLGYSILTGVALFAVVIGLIVAARNSGRQTSGIMAAVAFVCLAIQAALGYPLKTKMNEGMSKATSAMRGNPDGADAAMMMDKLNPFVVKLSPWFYTELVALGLAAAMGMSGGKKG